MADEINTATQSPAEVQQAVDAALKEQKKKKKKKRLIVFLVIVIIAVAVIVISSKPKDYDYSAPEAVVTADEIISEYRDDSSGADEKYKNKVIAVTGSVYSVEDSYAVLEAYDDDNWLYSVYAYMQTADDLKTFEVGDSITVVGVCKSTDVFSDVKLEDCVINNDFSVSPDYENAQTVDAAKLIDAYSANQVNADEAYKGKVLKVSGIVNYIADDYFVLYPDDDSYWDGIEVYFEDSSDLSSIKVNEKITIAGECYGGSVYTVRICRAVIK